MMKILTSVFAIVAVAAVAGVGSWAAWSDTEGSNGNYIAAGSLDLLVDGTNWDESVAEVTVDGAYPGATETSTGTVTNNGTVNGNLKFVVSSVTDDENGLIEPETSMTPADDATNGELCGEITVEVKYDGAVKYTGQLENFTQDLGALDASATTPYEVKYTVDATAGNEIMTDKCMFKMELVLEQV